MEVLVLHWESINKSYTHSNYLYVFVYVGVAVVMVCLLDYGGGFFVIEKIHWRKVLSILAPKSNQLLFFGIDIVYLAGSPIQLRHQLKQLKLSDI